MGRKKIKTFIVDEMGFEMSNGSVSLRAVFIREHLNSCQEGGNTNIQCPFCQKGVLRLVRKLEIYQGNTNSKQVGNCFYCECNKCCKEFNGEYQWE